MGNKVHLQKTAYARLSMLSIYIYNYIFLSNTIYRTKQLKDSIESSFTHESGTSVHTMGQKN